MPPKIQTVWMDVAIGDQQEYDAELAAYNRASDFFSKAGMGVYNNVRKR